jgi:ABC-type multidrug transport system ATPase subunit
MSRIGLWGVEKRRGDTPVLDGATLAVAAGEIVVFTGPRGAGQSTLLAVVATALRPDAGELELDGRRIQALQSGSLPYVRRNIGYLPADPPLVGDETVLENVMLALGARGLSPAEAEAPARAALEDLGIAALEQRRADRLSLPERRLVATARALAGASPVIVLDDPSAGLDDQDRARLVSALQGARASGSAILCGTSDDALASALERAGARRLRLEGGRLVGAAGAPLRLVDPQAGRPLAAAGGGSDEDHQAAVGPTAAGPFAGRGAREAR